MQSVDLSLELFVLQLDFLALPSLLLEEAVKLFELIFILALRAGHVLIAMEDPAGGQAFQIRTAVAVRAAEVIGQVLKFGHV
jgi:hypothetical protein